MNMLPNAILVVVVAAEPVVIAVVVDWKLNFSDFVVYLQQRPGASTGAMSLQTKGYYDFHIGLALVWAWHRIGLFLAI